MRKRVFAESIVFTLALALSVAVGTAVAAPAATVFVSNSHDSGPGSFRDAIEKANANQAITRVQFLGRVSTIDLQQTVWFTGPQKLTIAGNGSTLDGADAGGPAFRTTGGGDLAVFDLTVRNAPAEGIAVDVPHFATGTIHVLLFDVDIIDNDGHGVLVDDQDDPTTVVLDGDSDASVHVSVVNTRFIRNGFSVTDRDGLRVNEGGNGDLVITLLLSLARDNGADGVEVDERGAGDVRVDMLGSQVTGNGRFDPADLDDGFDIDESDDGSIVGVVFLSSANNNSEEGFDFNENHAGDLRVDMRQVEASGNGEEGIDYEEDDDFAGGGDLVTTMVHVTANRNGAIGGDAGLKIREKGEGNLDATLNSLETSNNLIGGISIREDAVGSLVSSITKATSLANSGHGIDFDENRTNASDLSGDLTATVTKANSSNNGGAGVRADQQSPPGVGSLLLTKVTLNGNTGGPTTGSNVIVTVVP
jgi:hypothetical protein